MQARNRSAKTGLLPALQKMLAAFLISAGSLVFSPFAAALGLGDLTLNSTLNEPLRATIALTDLDGLDLIDLTIRLGGVDDYDQAGLQRDALLTDLDFEVLGESGRGMILVTSTRAINEPFLNLILIANWPSGRLVREYTILLDLPGTAAVNAPATPPSQAISAVVPTPGAVNASPGSGTYTVQTGDTLFHIAEQTRPGSNVSVQQMMIALQRSNEDAFVNNNINRIITGRVLRIPPMQEIQLIDQEAANAQVNAQNQALSVQPLAGPGDAGSSGAGRDELTLLSGDTSSNAGSSDLEATIAALQNELMLSEENLDRARLENDELTARLASLDEEIDLLQNIIAIEDERLAQLQADLASQAEAAARVAAAAQATSNSIDNSSPPTGLVGQITVALQNNLVSLAAVLALVLLILGFLVIRRRRAEALEDGAFDLDAFEEVENQTPSARLAESQLGSTAAAQKDQVSEVAGKAAATGFLGGLMGRFRRDKDADEDEAPATILQEEEDLEAGLTVDDGYDEDSADADENEFELMEDDAAEEQVAAEITEDNTEEAAVEEGPEQDALAPVEDFVPEQADSFADQDDALDALESALDEIEGFAIDEPTDAADESEPEIEFDLDMDDADEESPAEATESAAEPQAAKDDDDILSAALDAVDFDEPEDEVTEPAGTLQDQSGVTAADQEVVDFNLVPASTAMVEVADDAGDEAEVFEFTLNEPEPAEPVAAEPAQEEVETFAFALSDEKPAPVVAEDESETEDLDVISFDTVNDDATAAPSAEAPATEDDNLELEEISFDDSMLDAGDDTEEESAYTPRTNMDECDTKLDLAVAYEAMGDIEGAIEILEEVIADGNEKQVGQAQKLKAQWQGA